MSEEYKQVGLVFSGLELTVELPSMKLNVAKCWVTCHFVNDALERMDHFAEIMQKIIYFGKLNRVVLAVFVRRRF